MAAVADVVAANAVVFFPCGYEGILIEQRMKR